MSDATGVCLLCPFDIHVIVKSFFNLNNFSASVDVLVTGEEPNVALELYKGLRVVLPLLLRGLEQLILIAALVLAANLPAEFLNVFNEKH